MSTLPTSSPAPGSTTNTASNPSPITPVLKTAGRTALMAILFVLLSRVLGVVRSSVIGWQFGQNPETDIYNRAFAVPDMLYLLMAGGAISTVFLPIYTEYFRNKGEKEAWEVFGRIVTVVALFATLLISIALTFAYPLSKLAAPRFSDDAVQAMVPLTRILLPAQFFFFVGSLFVAVLQNRDRWWIPNIAPLVYNMGIICGAIFFGKQYGTAAMAWGALAGACIGNFLLPVLDLWRSGARWKPGFDFAHPGVRKFGELMLPAMLGLGLSQLGFWLGGFFVSEEGGFYTALKNGFELTQAPIGIFAQASAIVLFPTITRLAAAREWPAFRDEIHFGLRRILFLTIPASFLLTVLAEPIITVLYASKKFGPQEIADAAVALRMYAIGTFAWSAQAVVSRGFFAQQDTRTPLSITKYMIVLLAGLYALFMLVFRMPFYGIAIAFSLVGTLNMGILLTTLSRKVGGLNLRGLVMATLRICGAAVPSAFAAWAISQGIQQYLSAHHLHLSRPVSLLALAVASIVGLAVYGGFCVLLRVPELRTIRTLFRRS